MWHDISFLVDTVCITVLPKYLISSICSMACLLHLMCKGDFVIAILFVSAVLILSPISQPLSFTDFSNSCTHCLQNSMSVISSVKSKSLIWFSKFNCMLLVQVLRSRWSMARANSESDSALFSTRKNTKLSCPSFFRFNTAFRVFV